MNVSPKNKTTASNVVQIHKHARFPRSKKWPTYRIAVPTGNALALQRSIFRENRLKFSTLHPLPRRLVSFVAQINMLKVRCLHTHTHTHTQTQTHRHTDTQTKYCNPRCACAPRVNNILRPIRRERTVRYIHIVYMHNMLDRLYIFHWCNTRLCLVNEKGNCKHQASVNKQRSAERSESMAACVPWQM